MARESRRKRDERRFGHSGLLVDQLKVPAFRFAREDFLSDEIPGFVSQARRSTVVTADPVVEFLATHAEQEWPWTRLPPCRLPYPSIFLEAMTPDPAIRRIMPRFGLLMAHGDPAPLLSLPDAEIARTLTIVSSKLMEDLPLIRSSCTSLLDYGLVVLYGASGGHDPFLVLLARGSFFLGAAGQVLRSPIAQIAPIAGRLVGDDVRGMKRLLHDMLCAGALAVGFMNSRGTRLRAVTPDLAVNRERRKAGFKPLLRHHVIEIAPVRAALRGEGQVETVGLARALHLCRGHWATFADSFMGRPLEHPMTVWRPWHVRGSASQGIVVSDYEVHPPVVGASPTCH